MAKCDNCGRKIAFLEKTHKYKDDLGHNYVFCDQCDAAHKVATARQEYEKKLFEHKDELKKLYASAKKNYEHKEYDAAISTINRILEIDPFDTEFQRKKAEIFVIKKKYLEALRCYNKLPDNYDAEKISRIRKDLVLKVKEQIVNSPMLYVTKIVLFLLIMTVIALASYVIDALGYVLPISAAEFFSLLSKPFLFMLCTPPLLNALGIFVNKQSKLILGIIVTGTMILSYIFVPLVPKFIAPIYESSIYDGIAGSPLTQKIGLVVVAIVSVWLAFHILESDEK